MAAINIGLRNVVLKTFLVSDDDDLSTSDLVRLLSTSMGKKALLLNIPVSILRICAGFVGKSTAIDKLCDSLQVDIQFTKDTLNWSPPYSVKASINRTTASFLKEV